MDILHPTLRLRLELGAARVQVEALCNVISEKNRELSDWKTHAKITQERLCEMSRELAGWERKYARLRKILDPEGRIPEPQPGAQYAWPTPGAVSLVDLAEARMEQLRLWNRKGTVA